MSFLASGLVVLSATAVALLAGYLVATKLLIKEIGAMQAPTNWGRAPDDLDWKAEAEKLRHSALREIRETAKAWAASISALLGVAGTVAFVKGPDTFGKLGEGAGNFAFWLTVVAALLAGLAIGLATFAAQGTPQRFASLDGWTLKKISRERAKRAAELLLYSRIATIVAALAILVGFSIAWKDGIGSEAEKPKEAEAPGHAVAVDTEGTIRCGHLLATPGGALYLRIHRQKYELKGANALELVEACPSDP
jgi:hypothetical protein